MSSFSVWLRPEKPAAAMLGAPAAVIFVGTGR